MAGSALLTPLEQRALAALWKHGPQTAAQVRADLATVQRFLKAGWVTEIRSHPPRGAPKLSLTVTGREVASRLPPAKPTLSDLLQAVLALRREVEQLRELLEGHLLPAQSAASRAPSTAPASGTDGPAEDPATSAPEHP